MFLLKIREVVVVTHGVVEAIAVCYSYHSHLTEELIMDAKKVVAVATVIVGSIATIVDIIDD